MGHQCHGDSCHSGAEHNNSCSCDCHAGCSCPCHHQHHAEDCHDMAQMYYAVADEAWMEVLKEKIKDHIRKNNTKVDQLATVIAEANQQRWQAKIAKESGKCQFEEKLKNVFKSGA